jgi:hypothetical protein
VGRIHHQRTVWRRDKTLDGAKEEEKETNKQKGKIPNLYLSIYKADEDEDEEEEERDG